jgi:hypothetical protein
MRKVDLFVPLLTGDPTTKAADIMAGIRARATDRQSMTEDQDWPPIIRQIHITLIILVQLLQPRLIAYKPLEMAEFGRAVSQVCLAATEAQVQLQALQRAKTAAR